ncbi:transcriptional regulator [Clostridia bacterium]|nr:transcriptional regulator [Clostridia bacterium]
MFCQNMFSKRLKTLRMSKNLKQSDLAKSVGVTNKAVSRIEVGQCAASIEVLCSLADYFNVSLDYLVGRAENPEPNK